MRSAKELQAVAQLLEEEQLPEEDPIVPPSEDVTVPRSHNTAFAPRPWTGEIQREWTRSSTPPPPVSDFGRQHAPTPPPPTSAFGRGQPRSKGLGLVRKPSI